MTRSRHVKLLPAAWAAASAALFRLGTAGELRDVEDTDCDGDEWLGVGAGNFFLNEEPLELFDDVLWVCLCESVVIIFAFVCCFPVK